jgi:chromosome segregation ATPase
MAQAPQDSLKNEQPSVNGVVAKSPNTTADQPQTADPDAQDILISSLRSQIQDLFSQVTQLNGKLVKSYDRVSDLEDDLHVASANVRTSSLKISQLELERTQHLSALNTGLLVEKSHVTAELTRLMEKATEEAAQRGQAESAKANIEQELDDLSANLFQQANSMVAEARLAQALSERKVDESEQAQKRTEELLAAMQQQMQSLQAEKENAQNSANNLRTLMGKGKWVERSADHRAITATSLRLLCSHTPYQEFLLFVAHLRSIHSSAPQPPAMSTLLPLPFLVRLLTEDSCVISCS